MGAVRVKCAKCGASLFTSSAGRKKVEEPPENRLCTCEHWETDHGIDKYCESANCVCDKFTAAKPEIVMGQAVMRPYKEFQVRNFEELSEHDYITTLVTTEYIYAVHHGGIMWIIESDNRKYTNELRANDIQIISDAWYCFMPYSEFIKSEHNVSIPVVIRNSPVYKALAKMAWVKKKKEKS